VKAVWWCHPAASQSTYTLLHVSIICDLFFHRKLSSSSSAWINSNMIMTVTHVNRLRHNNHHLHHLRLSGCIAGECRLVSSPSVFFLHLLLCPNREAKYCNKHVCMSVHLFAYLKNHTNFKKFSVYGAMAQSSWYDNGIRYLLPVCGWRHVLPITDPIACGIGNIYTSAMLEQLAINFQHIRQLARHCLTFLSYIMAENCTPRALVMMTRGVLPLIGGLQCVA